LTKWIKAKPVTNVSSTTIQNFVWQNMICHYRVPQQITIDNAKYFNSGMFKDFYHQVGMKVSFASVYHPQSNGAVEQANALIFEAIKKILKGEKMGKWAEDMQRTVWSRNKIVCRATNFTPFQILFGAEVVLPEEIKHQILRTTVEASPCPSKAKEKDLLKSDKLKAVTNLQKYQDEMRSWRDPNVKKREYDIRNHPLTEPSNGELRQARVEMGWTICRY
jgi:hypothetical protein